MPRKTKQVSRKRVRRTNRVRGQQVVAAAANVGVVATSPVNRIRMISGGQVVITNKEIILTVTGTPAAGVIPAGVSSTVIAVANPVGFPWLSKFTTIYDKFVFKALKLTWVPILPTTTSGSIAVYYDADDTTFTTVTFAGAAANERALISPVFQQSTVQLPKHMLTSLPWYNVTDYDSSPNKQGLVVATHTTIVLLNSAAATATDIGFVMAEYVVHLKNASTL